jgi:membrane associated rhomboid family serine protease
VNIVPSPDRRRTRVIPANPVRAAFIVVAFMVLLYAIEFADVLLPEDLDTDYGILPRNVDGLDGILLAPLLHGGWPHLIANTLPIVVLGWLVMSGGFRQFLGLTAIVWITAGVGTWLVGASGAHVGASGVAFGWLVFLLVRGLFAWSLPQIFVALVLFFYWGGMLWGVLPGQPGISWEGHLFGALGGLLAAWLIARNPRSNAGRRSPGTLAA